MRWWTQGSNPQWSQFHLSEVGSSEFDAFNCVDEVLQLGVTLVIQMIMGLGHYQLFHTEGGFGKIVFRNVQVTQLQPRLLVTLEPAKSNLTCL